MREGERRVAEDKGSVVRVSGVCTEILESLLHKLEMGQYKSSLVFTNEENGVQR